MQRFGKYVETTEPGPVALSVADRVPHDCESEPGALVEVGFRGASRNRDAKQAQMLTEDLNIIDIAFAVQYTLSDARAFLFNHRRVRSCRTGGRNRHAEVVKRKMDFLLNQGREEFAGATQKLMQQLLDRYGTGITISKLNLQAVAAPKRSTRRFRTVWRSSIANSRSMKARPTPIA